MRARISQLVTLCVWLASAALAVSADVAVSARLSHRTAEVGETVQLEVEVDGAQSDVEPPEIKVDGLEVRYAGPSTSQNIQVVNGRVTTERKTTHIYRVVASREGDFTIPPLWLVVDGRPYKTEPIALKVEKARESSNGEVQTRAFAEVEVTKKSAYVGEVLPVEVRFYLDSEVGFDGEMNVPSLGENGFTAQKFPQPQQQMETRNGRQYRTIIFQTAVTPTKAGKLTLGPCEIPFVAQMPLSSEDQGRTRRRNDPFNMLFDDFFGARRRMSPPQRYVAKAAAVEIDVKPLPTEGRPKDFSGAVGRFQFEAEGAPAQVKLGEPVTMKLTVTGEGNFDRVQAPTMEDPRGWKAYDASEKFAPGNAMKTTGTKVFEIPVIPEDKQEWMPRFQFSYFDPGKGEYVTLRAKPERLVVIGEPLVAPAPTPAAKQTMPTAEPTPATSSAGKGLAGLSYEEGTRGTFAPVCRRPAFWIANGVAGLVVFGLLAGRWLRRDAPQVRAATLRRERDDLWRSVRAGGADFYDRAAKLVQVQTALVSGAEAGSVDAGVAQQTVVMDEETAAGIAAIFEARAERVYAGKGATMTEVSAAERERVIKTLERFCGK